ncbi:sodium:solute symporter family protein [Candidatus Thioglobus sp.]|jgi:cation/acetate symporter|uniref:sodium:solute symporter family protein n=1 Tax=Candidatus Thioglobus sp. TaxID=2026721 RepID=UPI001D6689F7|nr:sodium:solute symporter family protein [Candidatus Thioglobus sp.]MBT3277075.1 cation acetate symporter [Candidatus Thioglobus sp.]MBT3446506.1 cation acetate symporter [Candidatus Thioglobus sp.]MBT3744400.1 cation acetate symporter [Candidatus Thioglobus sp.]MBT4000454.1 cation acetate symporter [Candidatus Thioglobus sp.]MBT4181577.1 cation acetate symporter [Candidatus Thioglobus sp.]
MDLQTLTFLFVGVTFAIYIGIAFWARAGSTKEFYVAGGGIHPVANGMATAADWMSAASFISMAGLIAFYGYGGSVFLMGWTGGYVLLAMLLAPYLRKHGAFTVPEFISDRYYSKTARVVAVICLIIASVTYVIGQMKGIGVAFSRFLEVDYETGLVSGMVIVAFYATMGGMKGITYTQIAQYVIMIIAYTIPAIFISFMLTGNPIPQLGLGSEMADGTYLLDKLDQVVTQLGFAEYTTQARLSTTNMFVYTLSLMIGTAGLPHVIMRFFTVSSVKAARESAGWALVFIALLYTTAPAVAAMARLNLMQTIDQPNAEQNLAYADRPSWFKNWETTGLLKFEDKNNDGLISYTGDKKTNEMVKVDRDIMVLANPEIAGLPNWVIAIVAAGGLAAALSTAAGLLLAIASSISHDLLKGVWRPNITEKEELRYSRISMIGAILIAGYYGFNPPDFAAGTVALAFGLAASSIFPALMMGIFSKKMNKEGAIAGMLSGIGITLLYVFQHKGIMFVKSTSFLGDMDPNWFLGIEPNAFGAIGAVVNFAVAFFVMTRTAKVPAEVEKMVENIRVPASN